MTKRPRPFRILYILLVGLVSGYVLLIFIRPLKLEGRLEGGYELGINASTTPKFMSMVEGRSAKPFVYRVLLPGTVRFFSSATPASFQLGVSDFVEKHFLTREFFRILKWETSAAYPFILGFVLMWLSYFGFAHFTSRLIILTCRIQETWAWRSALAVIALLGLPPFFKYGSFVYDPPQLFLFAASLYFLARGSIKTFLILFLFTCVNKETAVLLIPVCWFVCRDQYPRGRCLALVVGMLITYITIKSSITYAFRYNPGSFVHFQLLDHNLSLLTLRWDFIDVFVFLGFLLMLLYEWQKKAYFLRVSFACVFLPLVGLTLFFGNMDEWRDYYEAYPIFLGISVDTFLRIRAALKSNTGIQHQRGKD